ncbi:3-methyl-2-oxobutanoate hydroxymethyltransferase [Aliarcobacter butzleri RM4018]|uniref:3-methyl-2-oxobutanoate hydroxymethyltransferase n=1 Tax=Aliarcobacter butzleri (strain RM4018) TaxID=367737 RepID=PANB_ALIB4|nr:3-methyl-2-oxobutanoate hydroxymethyltransferase [Aliarcobacter butzleri]A8EVP8.1 RecName: Full=3-methyl-2-oxobutanoate hydroxymethyltransferase; AltName: Full=Ketopantoate hydroxymethyltransferase; Short=KPHMT [Aliarcobacter butzleri RM4018]ABV68021.1 3-methyl-2-oxobutanoate hydroxymethyltransferase [Aliarcobacter butzleri RM4018]GGT83969.1 3-methyl-2-oxobutanoate hydroxymethyltransferase [Aliarcobacter butzleri]SNV31700.1 3-methyl-2-oxobutanoate hydroxymethyltransferase [Aliarcobacter butz
MSIIKNNFEKMNITKIKNSKNNKKLTVITAYDALFAKLFEEIADMILVGDSLNMSFAGRPDTLSATLEQMIYHTNAVCNGAKNAFVIIDMPFGTYINKDEALKNCVEVYRQTNANAVKIEGGEDKADIIKHLTSNAVAVMGHIGLMPQYVRSEGGYKVRGKTKEDEEQLIRDAIAVEKAGAFSIVVEGVKSDVAKKITQAVNIPIIGIGAGVDTDGQVLVWSDMLGFFEEFKPKFVRHYLDGAELVKEAVNQYRNDVQDKSFPSKEEEY